MIQHFESRNVDDEKTQAAFAPPKTQPLIQYKTRTIATMIPASLRMATLFPCCAIRVNLPALPCKLFEKVEKAFVWDQSVSEIVDLGWIRGSGVRKSR